MKADLELWVVLARAYEAVRRHALADIARHDLTPGEFGVLEALYHREPLLLGELQHKVLVSSGGITFLVDRLAARGLVQRRPSPDDARARHALLTPAGRRLMDRIFPEHARALRGALSGLGRAEQRRAADLLRTLGLAAAARPLPGASPSKEQ